MPTSQNIHTGSPPVRLESRTELEDVVPAAHHNRRLTTTNDKISTITSAVGFESENHFKSVFRRATGMTMDEWRRRK